MFWKNQLVPSSGINDVIKLGKTVSPTRNFECVSLLYVCCIPYLSHDS
jgi:hypothetical protein